MVAIFTGSAFGFERGSAAVLGQSGLLGSAAQGWGGEGVFVNAATGNLLLQKQDEVLIGRGPDVGVARTYNSLTTQADDNNDKWRQSTDRRVYGLTGTLNAAGSTMRRVSGDGTEIVYAWDVGANAYVTKDGGGAYDRIVRSGAEWVWTDGDTQTVERYFTDTSGKIKSATDRNGLALIFTYGGSNRLDKVTSSDGAWIRYDYAGSTHNITQIVTGYTNLATSTAKTLTRTRYGYDGSNRLTTVTVDLTPGDNSVSDGANYVTTYSYDVAGRVSNIAQSDGSNLAITYDGSARVATLVQTASAGVVRTTSFAYGTLYTSITDPSGQVTRLDYDAAGNLTKITAPPAHSGAAQQVVQFAYNADGDLITTTDAAGQTTAFSNFTGSGLAQTVTDRMNNTVTRAYSATNLLLSETRSGIDASGAAVSQIARFVHDAAGNLRFAISAEGRVTEYTRNSAGDMSYETVYVEAGYTTAGTPTVATMTAWVNGLSDKSWVQKTKYLYDARGALQSVTGYGIANSAGTELTNDGTSVSTFAYDQAGQLLSSYSGASTATTYLYDGMGRVVSTTDANGGTTTMVYNASSLTTAVTLASGYVSTKTYNKAGDLVAETDSGSWVTGGTTSYAYDKLGRVRVRTDAAGLNDYFIYDNAGRLVGEAGHSGELTEYRYDANDRLIGTIRYTNAVSAGVLASLATPTASFAMASIRPAAHAQDISSWTVYDAEGRVLQTIAGDGSTTISTYDAAGRLQKTTAYTNKLPAGTMAGFPASPPSSAIAPTVSSTDTVSRLFYDKDGLLIGSLSGAGTLTQNHYDNAGQLVATTAYAVPTGAGLRASGSFASLLASVSSSGQDRTSRLVYDGQGLLRYSIDALGQVTRFDYDTAGNQARTAVYAAPMGATADYTYDSVKTLTATLEASSAKRVSYSVYDAAGRLAYAIDPAGAVIALTYDALGQITKNVRFAAPYSASSLPPLATIASWASANAGDGGNRVTRTWYTARGEVAFTVDAEGFVRRQSYNARGEVIGTTAWDAGITVSDATTIAQVAAAAGGAFVTRTFEYDSLGRLKAEWDGNAAVSGTYTGTKTEYAYLGATSLLTHKIRAANGSAQESEHARITYDAAGRAVSTVRAEGTSEAVTSAQTWDGRGSLATSTDARGKISSYAYDLDGRVTTVTDALGGVTSYEYNAFGEVWKTTDPNGNAALAWYDKLGREVTSRDAGNYTTTTTYTVFGEVSSVARSLEPVFDYNPQIYRMYDIALGRAPFPDELSSWAWRMENLYGGYVQPAVEGWPSDDGGTRVNRLAAAFVDILTDGGVQARLGGTDAQFVEKLYLAALDRQATSGEVSFWSASLAVGWTRAGMCAFFSEFYEHRLPVAGLSEAAIDYSTVAAQVMRMYDLALGRMPTAGEVTYWVSQMDNAYEGYVQPAAEGWSANPYGMPLNRLEAAFAAILTDAGVAARMAGDDTTFITKLYEFGFRRAPTSDEVSIWLGLIGAGWTRAGMCTLFSEHPDHRAYATPVGPTAPAPYAANSAATTTFAYDALGRVTSSTDALGNTENYTYNLFGDRTSTTNKGVWTTPSTFQRATTHYSYDRLGRLVRQGVTGSTTNYAMAVDYSSSLLALGTQDFGSHIVTTYAYDARGNRTQMREGYGSAALTGNVTVLIGPHRVVQFDC